MARVSRCVRASRTLSGLYRATIRQRLWNPTSRHGTAAFERLSIELLDVREADGGDVWAVGEGPLSKAGQDLNVRINVHMLSCYVVPDIPVIAERDVPEHSRGS